MVLMSSALFEFEALGRRWCCFVRKASIDDHRENIVILLRGGETLTGLKELEKLFSLSRSTFCKFMLPSN